MAQQNQENAEIYEEIPVIARKTRVYLTADKFRTIKSLHEDGDKISKIAKTTSLSIPTIYKAIAKLQEANNDIDDVIRNIKKLGPTPRENPLYLQQVGECLQNDPFFTQKGIMESLANNNINLSQPTICKYIKKLNITRKRAKNVSDKTLTAQNIAERKAYALRIRSISTDKILFLDETGFNLHTSRHYGYSPKGIECVNVVPANRGRNVSLLALIGKNGMLHKKTITGPYNSNSFLIFLNECKEKDIFKPDNFVVMDNVRFHKTQEIFSFFSENRYNVIYLPPYSPQLNPIEEFFSALKSRYFNLRPRPATTAQLIECVNYVLVEIDNDSTFDMSSFYRHMLYFLDLAFNGRLFN
jgi:transposase